MGEYQDSVSASICVFVFVSFCVFLCVFVHLCVSVPLHVDCRVVGVHKGAEWVDTKIVLNWLLHSTAGQQPQFSNWGELQTNRT